MPRAKLAGRVVVITGASSGIGRACALLLARHGAHVVVAARRREPLLETARAAEALGAKCLPVVTDVTEPEQVQRLGDAAIEHFGRVDVWVNNAGSGLAARFDQLDAADVQRMLAVNYLAAFHGCKTAAAVMRRQEGGHLINVGSMACHFPLPLHSAYTAAKCALTGFTEALAVELEPERISVSLVLPYITRTDFTDAMERRIPDVSGSAGPEASPERVAQHIVRCIRSPRRVVTLVPGGRFTVGLTYAFPGAWRAIAKRYMRRRLGA